MLLVTASIANAQTVQRTRFVNHTEFGGLFGRVKYGYSDVGNSEQVDNKASLTVQTFNGLQLGRKLSVGVTLGMDWYKAALLNPIAGGVRYDLLGRRNVKLYGTVDAGYAFAWFHDDPDNFDTRGGVMLNPGLGLKVGKPEAAAFTVAISYKRQEAHVTKPPLWNQAERFEDRIYNRLALRLGISF